MKIQLIGTGTIPDVANSASVLINDHILFDIPNLFFNDFIVRIYDGCELDENTVLMIFCSYYSDQKADSSNGGSSSSSKSSK